MPTTSPKPNPTAPPACRTEQLLTEVRRMPLFRQVIPAEAGIGWPLPHRRAGRVFAVLLVYGVARSQKGHTDLFPPFAALTVDWQTHVPVRYLDLRYEAPFPNPGELWNSPVGQFPHPGLAGWTVARYREARTELLRMYDDLFDSLRTGHPRPPEWSRAFSTLLRTLLEPALEPYYRALAPAAGFLTEYLPSGPS